MLGLVLATASLLVSAPAHADEDLQPAATVVRPVSFASLWAEAPYCQGFYLSPLVSMWSESGDVTFQWLIDGQPLEEPTATARALHYSAQVRGHHVSLREFWSKPGWESAVTTSREIFAPACIDVASGPVLRRDAATGDLVADVGASTPDVAPAFRWYGPEGLVASTSEPRLSASAYEQGAFYWVTAEWKGAGLETHQMYSDRFEGMADLSRPVVRHTRGHRLRASAVRLDSDAYTLSFRWYWEARDGRTLRLRSGDGLFASTTGRQAGRPVWMVVTAKDAERPWGQGIFLTTLRQRSNFVTGR